MSKYLGSDAVPDLADFATSNDELRTSYIISRGIVGSSLKRPRTLLESPVLTILRSLLEVALALLVGCSSGSGDVERTEKNGVRSNFRDACMADTALWLGDVVGGGTHHLHRVNQRYPEVTRHPADQSCSTRRAPGGRYTLS